MVQCKAKAKATGERCRAHALTGKAVCGVHGGKTPSGVDSPQYRHGRYSRHLPKGMADAYRASIGDPDLLNLTSELALLDARLGDQLARLEHFDPFALQQQVRDLKAELFMSGGDPSKILKAANRLAEVADEAINEHKAWRDARETLELRRKTVETEVRRRTTMAQIMTAEQVMVAMGYIKSAFDAIVPEPAKRRAFSDKLRVLFTGPSQAAPVEASIREVQ